MCIRDSPPGDSDTFQWVRNRLSKRWNEQIKEKEKERKRKKKREEKTTVFALCSGSWCWRTGGWWRWIPRTISWRTGPPSSIAWPRRPSSSPESPDNLLEDLATHLPLDDSGAPVHTLNPWTTSWEILPLVFHFVIQEVQLILLVSGQFPGRYGPSSSTLWFTRFSSYPDPPDNLLEDLTTRLPLFDLGDSANALILRRISWKILPLSFHFVIQEVQLIPWITGQFPGRSGHSSSNLWLRRFSSYPDPPNNLLSEIFCLSSSTLWFKRFSSYP